MRQAHAEQSGCTLSYLGLRGAEDCCNSVGNKSLAEPLRTALSGFPTSKCRGERQARRILLLEVPLSSALGWALCHCIGWLARWSVKTGCFFMRAMVLRLRASAG
jgi:hypothetical protein